MTTHENSKATGAPARRIIEQPAYSLGEAARYLHLPRSTIASWVHGREYPAGKGRRPRSFAPAIVIADPASRMVSFENLVEMHVLSALRRKHAIPLPRIREAMRYLRALWGTDHPLASQTIFTDGRDVFVRFAEEVVNASGGGQLGLRRVVEPYLERVDHDHGIPIRLYPFFGSARTLEHRSVAIDPRMRFGQPFLVSASVPTEVVAGRVRAGESPREVAADYGCSEDDVRDAVEFERRNRAA